MEWGKGSGNLYMYYVWGVEIEGEIKGEKFEKFGGTMAPQNVCHSSQSPQLQRLSMNLTFNHSELGITVNS